MMPRAAADIRCCASEVQNGLSTAIRRELVEGLLSRKEAQL